jgi:glycosyltransferase involved in cell wall biosynthesis
MLKILFVIPSLEYSGAAKQLTLLATNLPRDRFEPVVCVLGTAGPWLEKLQKADVACEVLGWTRLIDPRAFLRLRQLIQRTQPIAIHAWTWAALRASWPAARRTKIPVLASGCLGIDRQPFLAGVFRRWMLGRAAKVIASTAAEAARFRMIGISQGNLVTIPPAVEMNTGPPQEATSVRQQLGLQGNARLIGCIGPLTMAKGDREAIWALDILHYLYDDLHLVLIGEGPDRGRLERFARVTEATRRVHFLGLQQDVAPLLSQLDLVLIPSLRDVGTNVLLETMAAGKPFVASRWPGLSEFVPMDVQECLVGPGDKGGLARQAHRLLGDPERGKRLGEMGQQHVRDCFSVTALSKSFVDAYASVGR